MTDEEIVERRNERLDRGTRWVLIAVAGVGILTLFVITLGLLTRGDSSELVSQGDQQACMTRVNGIKEDANNELEKIRDRRDDLYDDAQVAQANGDRALLASILAEKEPLRTDLIAARTTRDSATTQYRRAGDLRSEDPAAFLRMCAKLPAAKPGE